MTTRQLKLGYFVLEGLNSFAATFYLYYLFFFLRSQFGFDNRDNLVVGALNGFVYMCMALTAGKVAQRIGYLVSLRSGLMVTTVALAIGLGLHSVAGQLAVMLLWTVGITFTWPALEAVVSQGESPVDLPRTLGIYNMVWAGTNALAYFCGGALQEALGPQSLFWLPMVINVAEIGLILYLQRVQSAGVTPVTAPSAHAHGTPKLTPRPIARTRKFLRLAWVANPFAYVAIYMLIAVMPGVAGRLHLSPKWAGCFGSIWLFSRLLAFWWLWRWDGWHYRFRWFLVAYLLLIAGFLVMLVGQGWLLIAVAQLGFGIGLGLIYYSSLFYSMDVGEDHGEHGGIHEAAIGIGIFAGPAVGALSLRLFPGSPDSGTWAVGSLLVCGLFTVLAMERRRAR